MAIDKQLTAQLITDIDNAGLASVLYWNGGISNAVHARHIQGQGITLPAGLLAFLDDEANPPAATTESNLEVPILDRNRTFYFDSAANEFYYTELFTDGAGRNGTTSTGLRRFNGMELSQNTGQIYKEGIRIFFCKCTKQDTAAGRSINIQQCDPNGTNIETIANVSYNEFGNRYGELLSPINIGSGKRLFFQIVGGSITNPQITFSYREVYTP